MHKTEYWYQSSHLTRTPRESPTMRIDRITFDTWINLARAFQDHVEEKAKNLQKTAANGQKPGLTSDTALLGCGNGDGDGRSSLVDYTSSVLQASGCVAAQCAYKNHASHTSSQQCDRCTRSSVREIADQSPHLKHPTTDNLMQTQSMKWLYNLRVAVLPYSGTSIPHVLREVGREKSCRQN